MKNDFIRNHIFSSKLDCKGEADEEGLMIMNL